jgi:hypothetical protein
VPSDLHLVCPELFPLVHICPDPALIREREGHPRRLDRMVTVGRDKMAVSQAVYMETDQVRWSCENNALRMWYER